MGTMIGAYKLLLFLMGIVIAFEAVVHFVNTSDPFNYTQLGVGTLMTAITHVEMK